jgi:hypothetical protein
MRPLIQEELMVRAIGMKHEDGWPIAHNLIVGFGAVVEAVWQRLSR